jgi:hypothetical protein
MKINLIIKIAVIFLLFSSKNIFAQNYALKKITQENSKRFTDFSQIQALDKITAKTSLLNIKTGEEVEFGRLSIMVHKCWKAPLDQKPENKILLEVFESKYLEDIEEYKKERIFYGWIFSSSPSISGIEHVIYDISAVKCYDQKDLSNQN